MFASKTLEKAQQSYTIIEGILVFVFALDNFRYYIFLLSNNVVVFSNHVAIIFLMSKPKAKPKLLRWIFLLQEFDLEIRDMKGSENVAKYHLLRLEESSCNREFFSEERLCRIEDDIPWFANMENFIVGSLVLE